MNLKRVFVALLLSVFLLVFCSDNTAAINPRPSTKDLTAFRNTEHTMTREEPDPQFNLLMRLQAQKVADLIVAQEIAAAKEAAERASAEQALQAEKQRQEELARIPLYGQGPIWTFDDCEYFSYGNVLRIVQILSERGIPAGRAIFFMNGDCYRSRPDLVATLHNYGYPIGNHGNTHSAMAGMNQFQIDLMIDGGPHEAMLFRPPYGSHSYLVDSEIANRGFYQMLWTLDSRDTAKDPALRSCSSILAWLRTTVRADSIVLMHMFNIPSSYALAAYLDGRPTC